MGHGASPAICPSVGRGVSRAVVRAGDGGKGAEHLLGTGGGSRRVLMSATLPTYRPSMVFLLF